MFLQYNAFFIIQHLFIKYLCKPIPAPGCSLCIHHRHGHDSNHFISRIIRFILCLSAYRRSDLGFLFFSRSNCRPLYFHTTLRSCPPTISTVRLTHASHWFREMSPWLELSPVSKPVWCLHIHDLRPAPLLLRCGNSSASALRHVSYSWSTTAPLTDSAQHPILTINWHTDFLVLSWTFHGCIADLNFVELRNAISRLSSNLMSRRFQPYYRISHRVANDAESILDRASVTLRLLSHCFNLRSRPPRRCLKILNPNSSPL